MAASLQVDPLFMYMDIISEWKHNSSFFYWLFCLTKNIYMHFLSCFMPHTGPLNLAQWKPVDFLKNYLIYLFNYHPNKCNNVQQKGLQT